MTLLHSGWGIHFLDYDNDGRKDLLVSQGHDLDTVELNFPQLHYKEPMLLARNTGKGFLDVSKESGAVFQQPWVGRGMAVGALTGHTSNRDAIGALVKLTTAHGTQYATVSTTGSYLSSNDKRVHFGLAGDATIKSIEIRWPSGIVQHLADLPVDRSIPIDEPAGKPKTP